MSIMSIRYYSCIPSKFRFVTCYKKQDNESVSCSRLSVFVTDIGNTYECFAFCFNDRTSLSRLSLSGILSHLDSTTTCGLSSKPLLLSAPLLLLIV